MGYYNDDLTAWYENDGTLSFTEHIVDTDADGCGDVVAVDLDGDGALDIVDAQRRDHYYVTYLQEAGDDGVTFSYASAIVSPSRPPFSPPSHIPLFLIS